MESFVLMPLATMSLPFGGLPTAALDLAKTSEITPQAVLTEKLNTKVPGISFSNQDEDIEALTRQAKADAIDTYFRERNMRLEGYGMKFVLESEKNDLPDWRMLAAISVIETTGGNNLCKSLAADNNKNPFGWGSCKIGFKTFDSAIETVARNLGGNNPKTAHHYDGKTVEKILWTYNPPSVVPNYAPKVMKVMDTIGEKDFGLTLAFNY